MNYSLYQDSALVEQGETSLDTLASLIEDKTIELCMMVIPGEQVTSVNVALPAGAQRHLDQALPYLVEDQLATPLETVHFARSAPGADGHCLVLIIAKDLMTQWHHIASALNLPAVNLIPEYLLLPVGETPRYCQQKNKTLVRMADGTGCCISGETTALPFDYQDWEEVPIGQLVTSQPASVNLLQGAFALTPKEHRNWIKPACWSLAASVVLLMAYLGAAGLFFHNKANALEQDARALYQTLFPNDKRIVNIRRQMQGHLNNAETGNADTGFLILLSGLSDAVAETGADAITPRHLQYSQKESTLTVELQANSLTGAHSLRDQLSRQQLAARILSVNQQDSGVVARLEVTAP